MKVIEKVTELKVGYGTHEGMSGKHNEDSYGFFAWKLDDGRDLYLGIVADGIGGQAAGEMASTVAVEAVKRYFENQTSFGDISKHLERAIIMANRAVYRASQDNPQFQGMGTTMVVAALLENRLFTAYVGDSRIYMFRSGELKQLSVDHTWAQEAIEAGLLTREQAKTHPNRNVIKRYLGVEADAEVDHRLQLEAGQSPEVARANQGLRMHPGDMIVVCSDGLTDMIDDNAVRDSLVSHDDLQPTVDELIDKANAAGGRDNITVVIMQVPGGAPAAAVKVPPAVETATAAPAPAPVPAATNGGGIGVPLVLVGMLGAILVLAVVVVGGFLLLRNGGSDNGTGENTPEPTQAPTVGEDVSPGAPATAGFIEGGPGTTTSGTPEQGDGLGPTPTQRPPNLLDTPTPTRTPRPISTRTPSPTPEEESTPTASPPLPGSTATLPSQPTAEKTAAPTLTPPAPPTATETPSIGP
jgi:protein phosphatase